MPLLIRRKKLNIFRIGNVKIYPGITEIKNEADIKLLKSHPSYQAMLDNGVHEEISKKEAASEKTTSDISKMNAKDAISIIQETHSIPILEDMYSKEMDDKGRKSVTNAIEDHIAEIKAPFDKPKED
jgi:hypothetical protein